MSKAHNIGKLIEFGQQLLHTEDLDPVYVAVEKAGLEYKQVTRLLIAYWCFYHLGMAARLSEMDDGESFWCLMENAASNEVPPSTDDLPGERWPRGSERRHFRGPKCVAAVQWLAKRHPNNPEDLITELTTGFQPYMLADVMDRAQAWPLFGPWISFKIADMLERVVGIKVLFPEDLALIYKEPRAALDLLTVPAIEANDQLLAHFRKFKAPPNYKRKCNIQEVETICCKWKSSLGGHYWIGKDIHEIRKGLKGWGATADKLLKVMPPEVEKGLFR